MPIILGVILDKWIHRHAFSREIWDHVRLGNDDLSVQYVVVGVVATIHHKGEVDHKACRVALAVGAGVRFIGWKTVVGEKFILAQTVNDDTSASAFYLGSEVYPAADEVNFLILKGVWIYRERKRNGGTVRVFGILLTSQKSCREYY